MRTGNLAKRIAAQERWAAIKAIREANAPPVVIEDSRAVYSTGQHVSSLALAFKASGLI